MVFLRLPIVLIVSSSLLVLGHRAEAQTIERFQLDNGLQVILRPVKGAKKTCLFQSFHFGNLHDPERQTGVAHFAEHLYVTAATEGQESRTAEQFMQKYGRQWNAQTGDDYTLFAGVFENAKLEAELTEAAHRLIKIDVTDADVDRELPRILLETQNMFHDIPDLALQNAGRSQALPLADGDRRLGTPKSIKSITRRQLQAFLDRYYKPNNATISIVGDFEIEKLRSLIKQKFGSIKRGENPVARKLGLAKFDQVHYVTGSRKVKGFKPAVGITIRNPKPNDSLYPAFLIVMVRLQSSRKQLGANSQVRISFSPLDLPETASIIVRGTDDAKPLNRLESMNKWMDDQLKTPLGKREVRRAKAQYGFILGLRSQSDRAIAAYPYTTAFQLARQNQMPYDPEKIKQAFERVDQSQLDRVIAKYFVRDRRVRVVWQPNKDAN